MYLSSSALLFPSLSRFPHPFPMYPSRRNVRWYAQIDILVRRRDRWLLGSTRTGGFDEWTERRTRVGLEKKGVNEPRVA